MFPELEGVSELADPKLLAARALRAIAETNRQGEPFFLTVFFSTAHFPMPHRPRITGASSTRATADRSFTTNRRSSM